jgi:hypothetical protein
MMATPCTCALCSHAFMARTSYGICPMCFNKDHLREWDRLQTALRIAEKVHVPAELSLTEWLSIIQDFSGKCAYCAVYTYSAIDSVNPVLGLRPDNCVPICRACQEHKRHGFETAMQRVKTYLSGEYHPLIEMEQGVIDIFPELPQELMGV